MSADTVQFTSESFAPDRLIAGDYPIVTDKVTVASSAALVRGAVLGKITTGGKYKLSATAAGDGSETPVAILALDCDASAGDAEAQVYIAGAFNSGELTLGTGHTVASAKAALRDVNIYIIDTQGA